MAASAGGVAAAAAAAAVLGSVCLAGMLLWLLQAWHPRRQQPAEKYRKGQHTADGARCKTKRGAMIMGNGITGMVGSTQGPQGI